MDSPRTPVQRFNDSLEDEDTDEMGSPSYHHIIPMHHRDDTDNDMDDVRIGWDDGFGSVFYRDDDCRKNNQKILNKNKVYSLKYFNLIVYKLT